MMRRFSWQLAGLLAFAGSSWGQAADEAFQGLKWGDSIGAIQQRFPDARVQRLPYCKGETLVPNSKLSCTNVFQPVYRVAGLEFIAVFALSASDKTLAGVQLTVWKPTAEVQVIGANCKQIESLLSDRYGKGRVAANDLQEGDIIFRTVFWEEFRGFTQVKFQCERDRTGETIYIGYMPKVATESRKL